MLHLIAFGLAVGAGIQATRNLPPDGPLTSTSAALLIALAGLAGYFGGRHRRGTGAVAVASANAEATAVAAPVQTVQVFVPPERERGYEVREVLFPNEQAPWIEGPRLQVDETILEGADLRDLELDGEQP